MQQHDRLALGRARRDHVHPDPVAFDELMLDHRRTPRSL